MSVYILVHGMVDGARKVESRLQALGHTVYAPDLPGHGSDKTPIQNITLGSYVHAVCRILDEQAEPAVLVGHSREGIVISQTAEARPNQIKSLIYLAAFLLRPGESIMQLAVQDTGSDSAQPGLLRG